MPGHSGGGSILTHLPLRGQCRVWLLLETTPTSRFIPLANAAGTPEQG